uniref:xanthine dehydrogenase n=1 Tax=Esox lucius TaxID=8010 RepID=A0A6Q2WUR0_ESOLU
MANLTEKILLPHRDDLNDPYMIGDELVFFVNGKKITERQAEPEVTLLTYLRRKLGLTGTKLGCAEGGCGACTVMISKYHPHLGRLVHHSVNSCLAPVCSLHHCAVTTVEGIGSVAGKLHPVQERIAMSHGSQCGFCTPGIVMSMYALLRNNPTPRMVDIEEAFQGNLCRCTGYRPILEGYKTFTTCRFQVNVLTVCCQGNILLPAPLYNPADFQPLDPTQEIIFPPELMSLVKTQSPTRLSFMGERVLWLQPASLDELLDLKARYPNAKLVVGNTEVGIEMKFKNLLYPVILAPSYIPELNTIEHTDLGIVFGASCSLTVLGDVLKTAVASLPTHQTGVLIAVLEQLRWFAGLQIRNVAVFFSMLTCSFCTSTHALSVSLSISLIICLYPSSLSLFSASRFPCSFSLSLLDFLAGPRVVVMDENFFPGYRRTILTPEEILLSVLIPYTVKYFAAYKQSPRREDDISIVTSGMSVTFAEGTAVVKEMALSYGGMAATTVLAKYTASGLLGKQWGEELLQDACASLAKEMTLHPSAPGGMVTYRRALTLSLFYKFYLTVQRKLAAEVKNACCYQAVPEGQKEEDVVGRPMMHLSAMKQATGEAIYCDDIPLYENELHLCLITSTKAHARILSIDTSEADVMPGVVTCVLAKDIPGSNVTGPAFYDETVLADHTVTCVGHIIGAVVADTQAHAKRAASAVKVSYEDLQPVIITIQDAITHQSFYQPIRTLQRGDTKQGFTQADHVLEGEIYMGGQEHFYLETNATVAVPKGEDGEMELFVSTQAPAKTQALVAKALGVPANRVVVRVKRMGGGFGGKESRSTILSTVVAVAAHKLKRPVRCMLDRDEDMLVTGGRHPFYGQYKVGYMKSGKVVALKVTFYSNAGNSMDLSFSIMERALFHMENSYNIANVWGRGYPCKTNLPSNTAFRGFGGPQGMLVAESWINDVAQSLGLPTEQVRRLNLYKQGDTTPYSQILEHITLDRCWDECLETAHYKQRRAAVDQYNRNHRWTKRGLAIVPTKFGISFTAAALVHIYTDGSVLLTHGGTEMGQGLHTKMVQVASRCLDIPTSKIHITETSTSTVPNTSPTAASASSDLNGAAVQCNAMHSVANPLLGRQHPDIILNPDPNLTLVAHLMPLFRRAFLRTPDLGYDFETNAGRAFNYFTYGVACSEVEIDCLTGSNTNLHTTIVMDVGNSLNPALDIGQVEGGFIQGVGLFTLEELKYSPQGYLFTRGPGMYKIPAFGDIPTDLTVSLLRDAPNQKAIFSSKAVGEPPLFLAASVFFAIKDAITAARAESGLSGPFRLDSPATPERIRNACEDRFTKMCPPALPGTFTPWAVTV